MFENVFSDTFLTRGVETITVPHPPVAIFLSIFSHSRRHFHDFLKIDQSLCDSDRFFVAKNIIFFRISVLLRYLFIYLFLLLIVLLKVEINASDRLKKIVLWL